MATLAVSSQIYYKPDASEMVEAHGICAQGCGMYIWNSQGAFQVAAHAHHVEG